MSLIKNPSELVSSPAKKVLIYGQPGIGKSTLALSAPNPVLLDFDGGQHRINGAHKCPTLQVHSWDEIIELLRGSELAPFGSIVVDTVGKMLDYMAMYIAKTEPKMVQRDGSLSQKGYGKRKSMFQDFLASCIAMNKNIICVSHEKEDKDNDRRYVRPDISGAAQGDLIKELDLVGYLRANGYKKEICWTPTDQFYGKNACNLPQIMDVPIILDKFGMPVAENNFLSNIFGVYDNYIVSQAKMRNQYDVLMSRINAAIERVDSIESANKLWSQFQECNHIWASKMVAKNNLDAKCASLGFKYNQTENKYEAA